MEMISSSSLFVTFFFICFLYLTINITKIKKQAYGYKVYPFLGSVPQFLANRHRILDWTTDILSSLPTHTSIFLRPGKVQGVFTAYPPNVEHFLKTRFNNYPKGPSFISIVHDFLGTGIFNSDGPLWRLQRKTASFQFNKRSLKTFVQDSIRSEIMTRLIPILNEASDSDRVLDLQDILEQFGFDNVCKLAFDHEPGCLSGHGSDQPAIMQAFEEAATLSLERFMHVFPIIWKLKKFFNIGSEKRLKESIKVIDEFAYEITRTRMEQTHEENNMYQDILSHFISMQENNNSNSVSLYSTSNNFHFLRDAVINFILAGRDTTSSGLSWFFWLLSLNPDVLIKIRTEVSEIRTRVGKEVGDTYGYDDLKEMNYLHGALSESLRLYPPVPFVGRVCLEDDVLPDGTEIKKDWFVVCNNYAMGRMESIWGKDCLEFRPERWLDNNGLYKPYSAFRYVAFNAGPRICPGKEMAYLQMKFIVASIVDLFEVVILGNEVRPEFLLSITLRMKGGLPVKVKARNLN